MTVAVLNPKTEANKVETSKVSDWLSYYSPAPTLTETKADRPLSALEQMYAYYEV